MNASDARVMRATLLDARQALVEEGAIPVRVERSEVIASATDEDEAPYLEMGQAIASARNRERDRKLAAIDDALRRLEEDSESFGVCTACGEDIPPRRLALVPYATLCVACQGAKEAPVHGGTRRKVTDYR